MASPERSRAIKTTAEAMTSIMMIDVNHAGMLADGIAGRDYNGITGWLYKKTASYRRDRAEWESKQSTVISRVLEAGERIDILLNTSDLEMGTEMVGLYPNRNESTWIKGIAYGHQVDLSKTWDDAGNRIINGSVGEKSVKNCPNQAISTFYALAEVLTEREKVASIQRFDRSR